MKRNEIEVGMRVKRSSQTVGKSLKTDPKFTSGEIVEESIYVPGKKCRGMEKVKVKFDNGKELLVSINQLKKENES